MISNHIVTNLYSYAVDLHQDFLDKKWHARPSFHNPDHIKAAVKAGKILIHAAMRGKDPLDIEQDLVFWSKANPAIVDPKAVAIPGARPKNIMSLEEFKSAFTLAIAFHDLGNCYRLSETNQVEMLDNYRSEGAEDRSHAIFRHVVVNNAPEIAISEEFKLAASLILQTVFTANLNMPFTRFMHLVDQISTEFFMADPKQAQQGLLHEFLSEDQDKKFIPNEFHNFAARRLREILPDEGKREIVLEIWGKEMPIEINGFGDEAVRVGEMLEG